MGSVQSHETSNPNSIAQKAALEALTGPQDSVEAMKVEYAKRRDYTYERVIAMKDVTMLKPQGAFYAFIDVSKLLTKSYKGNKVENVANLAKYLIEDYNVAVIPCEDFGFPTYIRLSYAINIDTIKKGLDRIEAFFNELA
jgi:aspartate aminotransferase